jgi:hypothetical protein
MSHERIKPSIFKWVAGDCGRGMESSVETNKGWALTVRQGDWEPLSNYRAATRVGYTDRLVPRGRVS